MLVIHVLSLWCSVSSLSMIGGGEGGGLSEEQESSCLLASSYKRLIEKFLLSLLTITVSFHIDAVVKN